MKLSKPATNLARAAADMTMTMTMTMTPPADMITGIQR